MIHAAAIALVHENDVHAGSEPVPRHAQHVLGVRRAFQSVDDNQGQWLGAIMTLPVAPATNLNPRRDFDQPLFRRRQVDIARQKKTSDGLHMPPAQPAASAEGSAARPTGLGGSFWVCEVSTN